MVRPTSMRLVLAAAIVLSMLLAGCYHEERWAPDTYRLGGVLAEGFSDEDRDDLMRRAAQRNAEVVFMESFPMQFDIRPLLESDCDNLRLELDGLDYVTSVDDCAVLR
jgi:hypothetical protein